MSVALLPKSTSAFQWFTMILTETQQTEIESEETTSDQSWYWTETWQAMEAEAARDLREGRYRAFSTVDELIESLDSETG